MKKILVGLGLLFSISAFGAAVIFSGNDVKTLKQNIDLNSIVKVISGSADPSSSATSANKGSIYLSTNGKGYIKQDAGSSTTWSLLAFNPMTTNGDLIYGGTSGVPTRLASGTNGYFLTMGANAPQWTSPSTGMAASNWKNDLTFTVSAGFGTITNSNFWYRRVGDSMEVRGSLTVGTPAASTAYIQLPNTYTIDTTKFSAASNAQHVGVEFGTENAGAFTITNGKALFYDGSTNNQIFLAQSGASNTTLAKVNGNTIFNTSEVQTFYFTVPISGWGFNDSTVLTPGSIRYHASSTTISGSLATITYSTSDYDSGSAYASGVFTAPNAGKYQVNASLLVTGTVGLNNTVIMEVQKNSSVYSRKTVYAPASITDVPISVSDVVNCAAGDTIRVQLSTSVTVPSIVTSNFDNYLSIQQISN